MVREESSKLPQGKLFPLQSWASCIQSWVEGLVGGAALAQFPWLSWGPGTLTDSGIPELCLVNVWRVLVWQDK